MNMSIQRDQNLVICPKKKKEKRPKLGHLSKKESQDLATTKHTYKCFKIRLEHSHNERISIRATKVNRGGCQGMIHRVQTWNHPSRGHHFILIGSQLSQGVL